jgi:hypothetical protein
MASVEQNWSNLIEVLKKIGEETIRVAKLELVVARKRKKVRAKWDGKTGALKDYTISETKATRRSVATGKLKDSMRYTWAVQQGVPTINIRGEEYAEYVNKGRFPYVLKADKSGKGIPPSAMKQWVENDKKLKPRDLKTGKVLPKTPSRMKSMAFLMNRKIKYFGIQPTDFLTTARTRAEEKYQDELIAAYGKDLEAQAADILSVKDKP